MADSYSDIWGEDFNDVLEAISGGIPEDVERLLFNKIDNLSFTASSFSNNINQQMSIMTSNGMSREAVAEVLKADMQQGGRIFGQLKNDVKEQVSGAINQSSKMGQNTKYSNYDKFMWVSVAGHRVCRDCASRAGSIRDYRVFERAGLPGTGWSVCKGFCYCILDPVGRMGDVVQAPINPEFNSTKDISQVNSSAANSINNPPLKKGQKPPTKRVQKMLDKRKKVYDKAFKLDTKSAREMLVRKGNMTIEEAQKFIATHRAKFKSVTGDTKKLHTIGRGNSARYTRDRAILHNRIARNITQRGKIAKSGIQPDVLMTGGYPGSGKSTMLDKVFKGWDKKYVHIDSDHVKQLLARFDDTTITWNAALYHEEADDVLALIFQKSFQESRHLLYDGTMKTTSKMVRFMDDFCYKGSYKPTIALVDLPMEKAIERAIGRAIGKTGIDGRFVDPTYMLSHYSEVAGAEYSMNRQTYDALKKSFKDILSYVRYNNDVPMGANPISIEEFFLP